jgi:hypothetical protein
MKLQNTLSTQAFESGLFQNFQQRQTKIVYAAMKSYFNYEFELRCGLPRVTLEGTVED